MSGAVCRIHGGTARDTDEVFYLAELLPDFPGWTAPDYQMEVVGRRTSGRWDLVTSTSIALLLRRRRLRRHPPRRHTSGAWSQCCDRVVWRPTGCLCQSSGSNSLTNGERYTVGASAAS